MPNSVDKCVYFVQLKYYIQLKINLELWYDVLYCFFFDINKKKFFLSVHSYQQKLLVFKYLKMNVLIITINNAFLNSYIACYQHVTKMLSYFVILLTLYKLSLQVIKMCFLKHNRMNFNRKRTLILTCNLTKFCAF